VSLAALTGKRADHRCFSGRYVWTAPIISDKRRPMI
jgi:hypothetical protein